MKKFQRHLIFTFVLAVISLSFSFYSSNFYPLLSSDDALNILMAHYYKLPHDIYCWGQDRGGTLIPMISQIFIKAFSFSALTSVSISNYLILIIGFIGFSSLFKSNYSKVIFAIAWFFPFQRFIELLRYPIGVEYSLIAFVIYIIDKSIKNKPVNNLRYNLILSSILVIFIVTIWVSDLAIVNIIVLLITLLIFNFYPKRKSISLLALFYVVFGAIAGFFLIQYAKSFATAKFENYLFINDLTDIRRVFLILGESFYDVLTFKTKEIFVSIYTYLLVLFFFYLVIFIITKKLASVLFSNKWLVFFIFDSVAVFITFIVSCWVLSNGMGRWYFVASYISISMAVLLVLENLISLNYKIRYLKGFLVIIVLVGAISPIYTMKYNDPKTLKPKVEVIGEFKKLGNIGVIAEFWNTFITSCSDPEMIKATTNDQSYTRNPDLIDQVFERKNLYIIKDMWLKDFPDTLEQYGYVLLKEGSSFRLGGCDVCKYNRVKLKKTFSLDNLRYSKSQIIYDNSIGRRVLFVSSNCDSCKERHFIYGPYVSIGIGEFTARFYMKANNFKGNNFIALLDVNADEGESILSSKQITRSVFSQHDYGYIDLDFKSLKRHKNVEFRIYYYGSADLYFDHLELIEK